MYRNTHVLYQGMWWLNYIKCLKVRTTYGLHFFLKKCLLLEVFAILLCTRDMSLAGPVCGEGSVIVRVPFSHGFALICSSFQMNLTRISKSRHCWQILDIQKWEAFQIPIMTSGDLEYCFVLQKWALLDYNHKLSGIFQEGAVCWRRRKNSLFNMSGVSNHNWF